ncbi:MAG TPA: alpha/beta hydrolase [Candidatus Binataceae bacterium]|nr:alpha/beta hydrolase [Candidatus Binataceae bacterium]
MPLVQAGSIKLHYETYGTGEPLLLLMGYGMPGAAWTPILPFLSGFQCIFFDNRGTGTSERPSGPYSVASMAEDASNLLQALGIGAAHIYGISMGGMIAQQLALDHPAQVKKLILGCTWCGGVHAVRPPEQVLMDLLAGTKLAASAPERALDILLPLLYPAPFLAAHPELKPMLLLALAAVPAITPEVAEKTLLSVAEFESYERLPQISCPVMIIHGDQDQVIPPANAQVLKQRLPQAELWIIPGAGHAFAGFDPVGIHQRIVAWLRS